MVRSDMGWHRSGFGAAKSGELLFIRKEILRMFQMGIYTREPGLRFLAQLQTVESG